MTEKDFERLYQNTDELTPSPALKEKMIREAAAEMEKKRARERSSHSFVRKWIPLAACFALLLVLGVGFFALGGEHYQTVYIDVNPSVALHVNRFGKISGVEYLNGDAEEALEGIKLKGLSAEDALESMITAYDGVGYFKEGAEIHISAVTEKNKNADKLLSKLIARAEKIKGNKKYEVSSAKLTETERTEADAYGISPGKYRVIAEVIEKHPEYSVEELKDKSMAELKALLDKAQGKNKK